MNNLSLSSKQDLSLFLEKEKFKRIFILCGKKSFGKSVAQKIFSSILKNKIIYIYSKFSPYPEIFHERIYEKRRKLHLNILISGKGNKEESRLNQD